jgi:predicted nucleic acid-binding protein
MTRVLLDTNVILDLFLNRQGFAEAAAALWKAHEQGQIEAFVAALTPVNVFYFTRKVGGLENARQAVSKLLISVRICPLDAKVLEEAADLPLQDYEDAVQLAGALAAGLDAIITRDLRDYKNSSLPVFAPDDFLALLAAKEQ